MSLRHDPRILEVRNTIGMEPYAVWVDDTLAVLDSFLDDVEALEEELERLRLAIYDASRAT